jgi:hypothetical protein
VSRNSQGKAGIFDVDVDALTLTFCSFKTLHLNPPPPLASPLESISPSDR